jgi:hypothetical protein
MALVRENPRSSPETWPSRGSIVGEGFFWAHYPPLEIGKVFLLGFVYVLLSKDAVISRFRFLFSFCYHFSAQEENGKVL